MPVITRFYGMIIKIYFRESEHNPPHFHVIYGEYNGIFDIKELKMLEGDLPPKAISMVLEWAEIYKDELIKIWETQQFIKLPPLQ
jgi:hypothetical protein